MSNLNRYSTASKFSIHFPLFSLPSELICSRNNQLGLSENGIRIRYIWFSKPERNIRALLVNQWQMSFCHWFTHQLQESTFIPGNVTIWIWTEALKQKCSSNTKTLFAPGCTFPPHIDLFALELAKGFVSLNCIQLKIFYQ